LSGFSAYCQALRRLVADGTASQERIQRTTVGTILPASCMTVCPQRYLTPRLYQALPAGHQPACRLASDLGANRDYRPMTLPCLHCLALPVIGLKYWFQIVFNKKKIS